MDCAVCQLLTSEVNGHERQYAEVRGKLTALSGTSDVDSFKRARAEEEKSRLLYEIAKSKLVQHQVAAHHHR